MWGWSSDASTDHDTDGCQDDSDEDLDDDNDGIPDSEDLDDDNDGINDIDEGLPDNTFFSDENFSNSILNLGEYEGDISLSLTNSQLTTDCELSIYYSSSFDNSSVFNQLNCNDQLLSDIYSLDISMLNNDFQRENSPSIPITFQFIVDNQNPSIISDKIYNGISKNDFGNEFNINEKMYLSFEDNIITNQDSIFIKQTDVASATFTGFSDSSSQTYCKCQNNCRCAPVILLHS